MPDLHPLLDPEWNPYDVGAMGAIDVRMLCEALANRVAGDDAARNWDGGLYYAAQSRTATTDAEKADPASIALVYLSRWKTEKSATAFANVYRASLAARYPGEQRTEATVLRTVDQSKEGPIIVEQNGRSVFISHSLGLPLAANVMALLLAAQTSATGTDLVAAARKQNALKIPSLTAPLQGFLASFAPQATLLAPSPSGRVRVY